MNIKSVMEKFFPSDNRGQGLSVNAIILIILGVAVLVILIAGFSMGWGSIGGLLSSENVNTIVSSCDTSCSTDDVYGYCSKPRELVDAEKEKFTTTCYIFSKIAKFKKYEIKDCDIECDLACEDVAIDGKKGSTELDSGSYDVSLLVNGLEEGQSCWIE